jgi:predicted transcriptional regulator of viral defense system
MCIRFFWVVMSVVSYAEAGAWPVGLGEADSLLPVTFTLAQAQVLGVSKHVVYALRDAGLIEPLARGLYRRTDGEPADLALLAIALKAPRATLCLTTALVRHDLSDAIPAAPDVAVPRGDRFPAVDGPVRWHRFDPVTFDIGRGTTPVDSATVIGLYSPERSIVDAFRTAGAEGIDLAYEALRRWVRRPGSQPSRLLAVAAHWSGTAPTVRRALAVLL